MLNIHKIPKYSNAHVAVADLPKFISSRHIDTDLQENNSVLRKLYSHSLVEIILSATHNLLYVRLLLDSHAILCFDLKDYTFHLKCFLIPQV